MHICTSCHRHVRETRCPFCGTASESATVLPGGSAMRVGMRRAAAVVGALALGGCSQMGPAAAYGIPPSDAATDTSFVAAYGIPADALQQVEASVDSAADAGVDASNPPDGLVAAYGVPPDAQPLDVAFPPDGVVAAYGIAPGDR